LNKITSLDWSKDSSLIRLTLSDFRRLYLIKDEEGNEEYRIENYAINNILMKKEPHIRSKFLENFWASNNCLLRWDTLGVFKPDPTRINTVLSYKLLDQNYLFTALNKG